MNKTAEPREASKEMGAFMKTVGDALKRGADDNPSVDMPQIICMLAHIIGAYAAVGAPNNYQVVRKMVAGNMRQGFENARRLLAEPAGHA